MKEPKVGQLCWFWNEEPLPNEEDFDNGTKEQPHLAVLACIDEFENLPYESDESCKIGDDEFSFYWEKCQPLTKQEIQLEINKEKEKCLNLVEYYELFEELADG